MRHRAMLLLLILASAVWTTCSARADALTGRWVNQGTTVQGGRYSLAVTFDGQGGVQTVASITAPRQPGTSVIRCLGTYRLDGGELEYSWATCTSCPNGSDCGPFPTNQMGSGGPVSFQGSTLNIGPESFKKQ